MPKIRKLCHACGGSGVVEWGMFCRECKGKGGYDVEDVPPAPTPEQVLTASEMARLVDWIAANPLDGVTESGLDARRIAYARYLVRSGKLGED